MKPETTAQILDEVVAAIETIGKDLRAGLPYMENHTIKRTHIANDDSYRFTATVRVQGRMVEVQVRPVSILRKE